MAKITDSKNKSDKEKMQTRWEINPEDLVKGKTVREKIEYNKLKSILENTAAKINDSKGIMELLPDLYLVKEILIASILSPKDLVDINLNIKLGKGAPPEIAEIIREHMSGPYDLNSKLSEILGEALFDIGSYTLLTIPHTIISNLIKENTTSMESIDECSMESIGLLESNTSIGLESSAGTNPIKSKILITDNPLHLLSPTIRSGLVSKKTNDIVTSAYGLENISDEDPIYLKRKTAKVSEVTLPEDTDIVNKLNPIVLNPPAESIIPVTVPGEPENHIGYFIVIDSSGYPLKATKDNNTFRELSNRLAKLTKGENTYISSNLGVKTSTTNSSAFTKPMLSAYINKFEKDLKQAVTNGVYGSTVDITASDDLYRLMFSRQLAAQETKIVYVPKELLTYVAFNYNELGIGVSLLEKTKLYASLRAVMLFAKIMAGVQNSVPGKTLNIILDENDPDHQGTIETVLTEFVALQTSSLPIGNLNPSDIINSLQRAGIQVKVDGGDVFPGTSIDVEDTKRDVNMPDDRITEELKIAHYAGLWVSPEMVDRSLESDFATGIASSDLLIAKRVYGVQKTYTAKLSSFIKTYIKCGGPLYDAIREGNDSDISIEEIINGITIALPMPDTAVIKAQRESYDEYSDFVETTIDLYVTDDIISDMLEGNNTGNSVETIRAAILSMMKRNYLRKQNMLPELDSLFNINSPITDDLKRHNESIIETIHEVLQALLKTEHRADTKTDNIRKKINAGPEEELEVEDESENIEDDLN